VSRRGLLLTLCAVAACRRATPQRAESTTSAVVSTSATDSSSASVSGVVTAPAPSPSAAPRPPETVLCVLALPAGDWADLGKGANMQEQFSLAPVGHHATVTVGRASAKVDQTAGACITGIPATKEHRVTVLRDGSNEGFFVKLAPGATDLGFDTMYANWRTSTRAIKAGVLSCEVCPPNARTVVPWAP